MDNGYTLFPIAPRELRRSDSDLSPKSDALEWLAQNFDVAEVELKAMTLRPLDGVVLSFGKAKAARRWVNQLRYSRSEQNARLAYCPECLQSDSNPYFRLSWRLAFTTYCEFHNTLLREACSACGESVWPAPSTVPHLYRGKSSQLHQCPHCGNDLRLDMGEAVDPHGLLIESLLQGAAIDIDGKAPSAGELTDALWMTLALFVSTRTQKQILHASDELGFRAEDLEVCIGKSFTDLPIKLRHQLLVAARQLFSDWPHRYVDFCGRNGLSTVHFTTNRHMAPPWLAKVVVELIRKQVRNVTKAQIQAAAQALESSGQRVTKSAVARVFGAHNGAEIQRQLGRRLSATSDEVNQIVARLKELSGQKKPRRSSRETALRDACILLLAFLLGRRIDDLLNIRCVELDRVMAKITCVDMTPLQKKAIRTLQLLLRKHERLRRWRPSKEARDLDTFAFQGFRGSDLSARGPMKMLCSAFEGLDQRLWRSVTVTYDSLALEV